MSTMFKPVRKVLDMVAMRKIARKKMRKIYNYILIACFVLSATTCNAQQQKRDGENKVNVDTRTLFF